MNPVDALPASGLVLFFVLGLRHGVEPDHIAAIDGMTLRALDHRQPHAAWTGSLFALGHGAAIAAVAIAVSLITAHVALPPVLIEITTWLPIALLALLGAWNLRALLAPGRYQPSSVRMKLMPASLRERSDMWSTVAIGLLFALVVDTLAHISAWSVFATHQGGGWLAALVAGLLFSVGMLVASTASSQLIYRIIGSARSEAAAVTFRRAIGWVVVLLSFGVVAVALADKAGLI